MSQNQPDSAIRLTFDNTATFPVHIIDRQEIDAFLERHPSESSSRNTATIRFYPDDQARPWRDFRVQNGARRFLREIVLTDWINRHPHPGCSNIRVDEWGRLLCRYITPTGPVDGPWENPTHFLFYAYNRPQVGQYYNTTLNTFLREYCDVEGTLPS